MSSSMVSIIVAASDDEVIGRDNALPWKLATDMARFRALTSGKPVLMGRRTWEAIGRPLPGRTNIVITRAPAYVATGATTVPEFAAALAVAGGAQEIMVIGGAQIYALALPIARRVYLTRVHGPVQGDTYLRGLDPADWHTLQQEQVAADERNSHATTFSVLQRR